MPLGTLIPFESVPRMLEQVFEPSIVDVYTSDSKFGQLTKKFISAFECIEHFKAQISDGSNFVGFAIHYPDTNGYVEDRRMNLDSAKCDGHSFRYSIGGWGVINLQFHIASSGEVGCNVDVNSEKRAKSWIATYPEFKAPELWNWKAVEKHARRLKRCLQKLAVNLVEDRGK